MWMLDDEGGPERASILVTRDFPRAVEPDEHTATALKIVEEAGLPYLPVVGAKRGRCLGVVLRKALVNGCRGMGHDMERCPVSNHLYEDIRRMQASDRDESVGKPPQPAERPSVIVDADGAPLQIVVSVSDRG